MSEVFDAAANLAAIAARIEAARQASLTPRPKVTLVAVSKTHPAEKVEALLRAGHGVFGENRVQEAQAKFPALKSVWPGLELHLIGPLQTNKVKEAVALFDVVQSVDRPKLARALAEEMAKQGRSLPCFVQVNTGEEEQKAGIAPGETEAFVAECRTLGLNVVGLMCIPPAEEEPSPHFALLAKIAARNGLDQLSMGMSGDFETAIRLGATYVRVGTALFGARQKPQL
ncbi:MAG: YggS family pyridoxal phosphate-dependent enzyme [Alphaproteobacteria bacterium]|jgi:pyridoxal phosphate enzyme (YggS family)|nr:YggS family pyridoxal phosphate-dependent enzyme [Alphaproteobacteria bacterium]